METLRVKNDADTRECIILSCSGASKLGDITDKLARKLSNDNSYKMSCLAKVAARDKTLLNLLQANETLVIDGCNIECAKKIMEEAWLTNYRYVKLTDLDFVKDTNSDSTTIINKVYNHINNLSELNVIEHTRPNLNKDCNEETCDMFDFLSDFVGLKILHPGGKKATKQYINLLNPTSDMKILDIACGKGRTSVYVAKKFGCKVVGIDIREDSIEEAKKYAVKNRIDHLVSFQVADAEKLPFGDNEFDMTMSQAMLILVDNKNKVVDEAVRVLKPGGTSAWLELSWKKDPTNEFLRDATDGICAMCISNVITFDQWEKILNVDDIRQVQVLKFDMSFRGLIGMLKDEGIINGIKVMYRYMLYPKIRNRMKKLDNFFRSYPEYIGYGIYIGSK